MLLSTKRGLEGQTMEEEMAGDPCGLCGGCDALAFSLTFVYSGLCRDT